jgi:hypothetical protein
MGFTELILARRWSHCCRYIHPVATTFHHVQQPIFKFRDTTQKALPKGIAREFPKFVRKQFYRIRDFFSEQKSSGLVQGHGSYFSPSAQS